MDTNSLLFSAAIAAYMDSENSGTDNNPSTPEETGLKELIVCLARELPEFSLRTPDKMYFLFDKLELFIGQTRYNDPFAIVEKIPDNPVFHMLYFCLDDGKVKIYTDYSVKSIAKVSTPSMLNVLKQSGTTFFTNADKRYLDEQRHVVHLPYRNGTYELTVDLAKNLQIDEKTIIAFNPETNMFEFTNHYQDYDLVFGQDYYGAETNTIKMDVSAHRIAANIKISQAFDNIIKQTDDGIYAVAKNAVPVQEFQSWKTSFQDYKAKMEYYLAQLIDKIEQEGEIGLENLNNKITEAIQAVIPEAQDGFSRMDDIAENIDNLEARCKRYSDQRFDEAFAELKALLESGSSSETWTGI